MDGRTYYMRLIAVNINKHTKRSTNKMNYSNNLLVKIILQCSNHLYLHRWKSHSGNARTDSNINSPKYYYFAQCFPRFDPLG